MKYSDTTNLNGVIQEFERLIDGGYASVSGDTTKLKEATALANDNSSRIWHLIFSATGNWQYDDSNFTDLPMATTDLVSGTARYALPSEALTIQRVELMDSNGEWYELKPLTKEMIGMAVDEFLEEDAQPEYYTLVNNTIELFAAPNYNSTNGLKVYFDREISSFATSDTTKTPGFASPYHQLLPIKMAISWYGVKQPQSATLQVLKLDEQRLEAELKQYYGMRFKDLKPRISRMRESFK